MGVFLNRLESKKEIEEYKKWLKTKSLRRLRYFINDFERDLKRETPLYTNHKLRIELVMNEIKQRLH